MDEEQLARFEELHDLIDSFGEEFFSDEELQEYEELRDLYELTLGD